MPPITTNKDNLPPTRRACGRCGQLGHLVTTCRGEDKAYDMIGVEVEGYWKHENRTSVDRVASNWHMSGTEDGSLNYGHQGHFAYEWRTRPGSLGEAISQLLAVYPEGTDAKAGMHVHVSFKEKADITALASEAFFTYFREQWEAWGVEMQINPDSEFFKRLRGENDYCRVNTMHSFGRVVRNDDGRDMCSESEDCETCNQRRSQIRRNGSAPVTQYNVTAMGSRYWQLNFTSFARHGTVECRLLPMFRDARLGVLAIEKLISIYETFLREADARVYAAMARKSRVAPVSSGHTRVVTKSATLPTALEPRTATRSIEMPGIPTATPGHTVMPRTRASTFLANTIAEAL